jgi:predicted amidohydrolase
VIAACQGGTHTNGRQTYGHAMIVDPWGEVIASASKQGNAIIYANIDLKKLYDVRSRMGKPGH